MRIIKTCIVILLLINISIAANINKQAEKSGLFVGINIGISIMQNSFYDLNGVKKDWREASISSFSLYGNTNEIQGNLGVKIGWSKFFNQLLGVRIYANYDYSNFRNFLTNARVATEDISFIGDVMLNFFNNNNLSFGVFIGVGIGYELPQWSNADARSEFEKHYLHNGLILPISFGFSATIMKQHKIEISTKFPTIKAYYKHRYTAERLEINPYILSVGYSYIF